MPQTDDQKKMALLEEYVQTLERQNFAKNGETTLLYEQITSLREQNQMLKQFIESMKNKWEQEKQELTEKLQERQNEDIVTSRNFGDELRSSVDINSLKAVAEDMRCELEARESQINHLSQEKSQLLNQVQCLRDQLTETTFKITKSEEKLRNQLQVVKQLENQIFGLRNSRCEPRTGVSFAKLEVDKLVKQNNELIEKIRVLEKQKNGYYNELKMASPLRSRASFHDNKSAQKRSQCQSQTQCQGQGQGKSQRWNLMEEKLRAIRNENEQLKANLAIY